jgi:serine/threonine protein kinase
MPSEAQSPHPIPIATGDERIQLQRMAAWPPSGWNIEKSLSEGGQAWTYLARRSDGSDQKLRVIKRLKNKDRLARFVKEIEALRKLSHPGIVAILETTASPLEAPFYVAEYCERGDLSKVNLSSKSLLEKLLLYRQICNAIAVAHRLNILHRDLKPQNVLVRADGSIAVGDFGLCLDLSDIEERLTSTSEAVGARHYIAPELEDGRTVDPKPSSDCYSLGKLLYYILSRRSFSREQHRSPAYNLLKSDMYEVDPYLHAVYELLDKTIDAKPEARYQNAEELCSALDGVIMAIERKAHALNMNVPQHCLYCVTGEYRRMQIGGSEDLEMALICWNCGNIQRFSKQHSGARNWWKT